MDVCLVQKARCELALHDDSVSQTRASWAHLGMSLPVCPDAPHSSEGRVRAPVPAGACPTSPLLRCSICLSIPPSRRLFLSLFCLAITANWAESDLVAPSEPWGVSSLCRVESLQCSLNWPNWIYVVAICLWLKGSLSTKCRWKKCQIFCSGSWISCTLCH